MRRLDGATVVYKVKSVNLIQRPYYSDPNKRRTYHKLRTLPALYLVSLSIWFDKTDQRHNSAYPFCQSFCVQ